MVLKKRFILAAGSALFCLTAGFTYAQESVTSCADIANADERLACYDRAAEASRNLPVVRLPRNTQPASTPSPASEQGQQQGNSAPVRQDVFGLELKQEKRRDEGPKIRTYRAVAASHNDFTGWTIEFEGGSKWKQVGTDDYDIEIGETYTVRRATFNSYILSNGKNNRKIRVTRIE
jgi:hypothetical protein